MASLFAVLIAFSYLCLQTHNTWAGTAVKDIAHVINADPRLKKARQWAEESGILEQIDFSLYGGDITLVLPSNEAFEEIEREHPTWKATLISEKADMETLLLFASTDHRISVEDVRNGAYQDPDSIISILSEYSSMSKDGKLCVADYTRAVPCSHAESLPCCAHVDLDQPIESSNGNIYIIDKVLLPQDLIDKLVA